MMNPVLGRALDAVLEKGNKFTRQEQHIQQILAITSASISLLSGIVSFYWFARMKRNYRHQYVARTRLPRLRLLIMLRLIMILIGSDMLKALWCWIPPIVILARQQPVSPGFCQGAGFLLALGIEASGSLRKIDLYHHLLNSTDQTPLSSSWRSIRPSQSLHRVRQTLKMACIAIDGQPTLVGRSSQYSWRHWPWSIQTVLRFVLFQPNMPLFRATEIFIALGLLCSP